MKKCIKGGEYKKQGNKNGKWVELSNEFCDYLQLTYNGRYQNGIKVGVWETCLVEKGIFFGLNYQQIGGGSYDEKGNGIKIGKWIELSDQCEYILQITYNGEYKNGKRFGRWDIKVENNIIGGGYYDSDGMKIGKWMELRNRFEWDSQITYNGEYKNGKKIGRWDILYRNSSSYPFEQIGGGSYDEDGDDIKIGQWIELTDNFGNSFSNQRKVTYNGEYKQGKKFGIWVTMDIEKNQKYDEMKYDI